MFKCFFVKLQRCVSHPSTCVLHSFRTIIPCRHFLRNRFHMFTSPTCSKVLRTMLSIATHRCPPSLFTLAVRMQPYCRGLCIPLVVTFDLRCRVTPLTALYVPPVDTNAKRWCSNGTCHWGSTNPELHFARRDEICTTLEVCLHDVLSGYLTRAFWSDAGFFNAT